MAGVLLINPALAPQATAATNNQHPSVVAAFACMEQIAPIIRNRNPKGRNVACDIPVSLSEQDLDELLKAALKSANMNEKVRGTAEKYSSVFAKTLTNFRAATCVIKLRIKRQVIVDALIKDNIVLQLPDQPTTCDVTTKKHKIQKLSFAFSPRIDMMKGCISKFALNMGKIDADCRVCYFNRLYLSTKLVGLWANRTAENIRPQLNRLLGGRCRSIH